MDRTCRAFISLTLSGAAFAQSPGSSPCVVSPPTVTTILQVGTQNGVGCAVDGDDALVLGNRSSLGLRELVAFRRGALGWNFSESVDIPTTVGWAWSTDIALEDGLAAIAFNDNSSQVLRSEVFVAERLGATWVVTAVAPPTGSPSWPFRVTVAVAGGDVVIGSRSDNRVRILRRVFGAWSTVQVFDGPPFGELGTDVHGDGTLLAALDSGVDRVSVYERAPTALLWTRTAVLDPGLQFGSLWEEGTVAIAGDVLAVGKFGVIQVYERSATPAGSAWTHTGRLDAANLGVSGVNIAGSTFVAAEGLIVTPIGGTAWTRHAAARFDSVTRAWVWAGLFDAAAPPVGQPANTSRGFDGHTLLFATQRNATVVDAHFSALMPPTHDCDGDCTLDVAQLAQCGPACDRNGNGRLDPCETVGVRYCSPNAPHQGGFPAYLYVVGDPSVASSDLAAVGTSLPAGAFAMLVAAGQPGFSPSFGGGAGALCVGGAAFGRYANAVQAVASNGVAVIPIDPRQVPAPAAPLAMIPGQTWYFQLWYRDGASSNFSDAVAVTFE